MDYEKAYKEALETVQEILSSDSDSIMMSRLKLRLQSVFPELAESEDERIRNEIIKFLELPHPQFVGKRHQEDWLAWLEKQGEQETDEWNEGNIIRHGGILALVIKGRRAMKSNGEIFTVQYPDEWVKAAPNEIEHFLDEFEKRGEQKEYTFKSIPRLLDMIEPTERAKAYTKKLINTLTEEGYITDAKIVEDCLKQMNGEDVAMAVMDEKQGEKPQSKTALEVINEEKVDNANKVEPKFHECDWIVSKGHSYLIADIDYSEHRYLFEIGGYTHEQLNWEYIEIADKRYHLWTIADAKDGDVLYSPWCGLLWIFEDEKKCHVGYNLNYNSDSIVINKPICIPADVQPATKEQCDLLFTKMHESGYEWDAEKKEVKKIEDEKYDGEDYGIDSLFHAKRILEKTLGEVDGYQSDDGILEHKCAIAAINKLYKQKPTWSEEDSVRLQRIIDFLWKNRKGDTDTIYQQEQDIEWLKSLKKEWEDKL